MYLRINKYYSVLLSVPFLLCMEKVYGQGDSTTRHHNEFGIDIVGTIRFFTFSSAVDVFAYTPTYFFSYRRYFEKGNIRFGIGAGLSRLQNPSPISDSVIYKDNLGSVDSRFGWEFKTQLSKKWQVFYGLDFKLSLANRKNEAAFFNSGYAYGFESHSVTFGLASILGVRFNINSRISLTTEANFTFNYIRNYEGRNFYTIYLPGYPELPDQIIPNTRGFYTQFNQPITTYLVFNF